MSLFNLKKEKKNRDNSEEIPAKDVKRFKRRRRILMWMWGTFLGIGLVIALLLMLIYNGVIGYMPPIEELENPRSQLASVVYADDGETEIGRYYQGSGNRVNNEYNKISPYVIDALIATEDVRFEDHSGVDFRAIGRSIFKTLLMRDKSQGGGSTITQQLAKQLYSEPSRNLFKRALQKPIEWMIAIKLERFYTKQEILEMYLNRFDFLNNAVGINTASNVYFNKEPEDLNIQEAATLVGMLKNPSYYNPRRFEERTRERRNVVLDQMAKAGKISQSEANSLKATPLDLRYTKVDHSQEGMPYFREEIRRMMTAKKPVKPNQSKYKDPIAWNIAYGTYRTDSTDWENNPLYGWIEKNPKPNGSKYDIYTDGLKIYTTIDLKMQQYAEEAVYQHVGGTLQTAFFHEKRGPYGPYTTHGVSKQQAENLINAGMKRTARWKNMKAAGHSDKEIIQSFSVPYNMEVFAYDKVDGKIVPSTKVVKMSPRDSLLYMKTILRTGLVSMDPETGYVKAYVGGMDYKWFQYDMAGRGKRQIGSTVKPFLYTLALEDTFKYTPCTTILNSRPRFGGWSPKGGGGGGMITLKQALTSSNNAISAKLIYDLQPSNLVNKMRMFGISGYIEPSLPLCLGTPDVSVKEMVSAYTTFPNDGLRVDPVYVTKIEDNQGNVIYTSSPHHEEVTSRDVANKMVDMMESVVNRGTGKGLRGSYGIKADMGGKTGTTNNNSDSWFIGYTPQLVTGVWVGGEERAIRFNTMTYGQGAKAALPVYGLYMRKLYDDPNMPYEQDAKFRLPENYNPCNKKSTKTKKASAPVKKETVDGFYE